MSSSRWRLPSLLVALTAILACGSDPVAPINPTVTLEGRLEKGDSARVVISREGGVIPVSEATVVLLPASTAHLQPNGWVKFDAAGPLEVNVTLTDGTTGHVTTAIGTGSDVTLTGRLVQGDSARLTIVRNGVNIPTGAAAIAITPAATAHLLPSGWVRFDATGPLDVAVTFADGASRHVNVTIAPAPIVNIALQGTLEKGDSALVVITSSGTPVPVASVTLTISPTAGAHLLPNGYLKFDAAGPLDITALLPDGASGHVAVVVAQPTVVVSLVGRLLQGDSVQVVIRSQGATVPVDQATLTVTPSGAAHLLPSGWLRLDAVGALTVSVTLPNGGSGQASATVAAPTVTLALQGRQERSDSVLVVITREGVAVPVDQAAQVTVSPAANARLSANGWLVLTEAGPLDVTVVPATGGTATLSITVATPPMIAYDYLAGGNRDIYVAALDGRDIRRLTTSTGDDQHPSAAAGRVVFTSYRNGNAELYSVPLAGGTETRLTTTSVSETEPSLSPDGSRVAYISSAGGLARVWLASSTGTGQVALGSGASTAAIEAQPSWSATGDRLVFTSTNSGNADLYTFVFPAGPSVLVPSAKTTSPEVEPSLTPDGAGLVFVAARAEGSGLYRSSLTDTVPTLLLAGSVGQPVVLADGRVVFAQFSGSTTRLRWLDPAAPTVLHDIPLGAGSAAHAAAVRGTP